MTDAELIARLRMQGESASKIGRRPEDTLEAKAATRLSVMREALEKSAHKFEFYEQCHRLKCTSEGDEKADRNREMADMCRAALGERR